MNGNGLILCDLLHEETPHDRLYCIAPFDNEIDRHGSPKDDQSYDRSFKNRLIYVSEILV